MLKKIGMVLFIVIAGVLVAATLQPPEMAVYREIVINASPEAIFPYINNAKKSYEWMPWADGDPSIEIQYSGPDEGVGAMSKWHGKQMGTGTSLVTESISNKSVKTKLEYTEPFAMTQDAEVALTPSGSGTSVRWSVSGHNNFMFRIMGVFVDCDKMIGGEFEKGLTRLKVVVEAK
jgi:hypothetical protein